MGASKANTRKYYEHQSGIRKENEVPGLCDCKECEDEGNNQNVQEGWITREDSVKGLETNSQGERKTENEQTEKCQNENVPKGRKDNSIRSWLMRQKHQETL